MASASSARERRRDLAQARRDVRAILGAKWNSKLAVREVLDPVFMTGHTEADLARALLSMDPWRRQFLTRYLEGPRTLHRRQEIAREFNVSAASEAQRSRCSQAIWDLRNLTLHPDQWVGLPWRIREILRSAGVYEPRSLTFPEVQRIAPGWGPVATDEFNAWMFEHDKRARTLHHLLPEEALLYHGYAKLRRRRQEV